MQKDKSYIRGHVRASVLGPDGKLKKREKVTISLILILIINWFKHFVSFAEMMESFKYQVSIHHNIVTNEGDALIADLMSQTPARSKVDNTNGRIQVGTGYTSTTKTIDALVTPTGTAEALDATYPKQKGAFLAADDNVVQYRCTFEAGDLNVTGVDEAILTNGTDTLAYAQITPTVDVASTDTLQVDWELTILGA